MHRTVAGWHRAVVADDVKRGWHIGLLSMGGQPYVWVRMGAYGTKLVPGGVLMGTMSGATCSALGIRSRRL